MGDDNGNAIFLGAGFILGILFTVASMWAYTHVRFI